MIKKLLLTLCLTLTTLSLVGCSTGDEESFDTSASINVYTRDTSSGTREGFFANIGASNAKSSDEYLVSTASVVDGNGSMINSVAGDEFGIGYISLTSLSTATGVSGLKFEGVEATEANVLNGTYEMSRWFSYVTADDTLDTDTSLLIAEFNKYVNSKEGQAVLLNSGVIVDVDGDSYTPGAICTKASVNATIKVGGSTSVESASKAVTSALSSVCGNFSAEHSHTGSGDSDKVYTSPADMHIGFSSAGIRSNWTTNADEYGLVTANLGQDAIVVVVNEANPLENITADDLVEIYVKVGATHNDSLVADHTTNITKWDELITE